MERDDRLGAMAYAVFAPLALLTVIFGPALVLFAEATHVYWAWEIKPAMSAVWVGAGYTFGGIAITTMLIAGRWRSAIAPMIATWFFSLVIIAATSLHQDRFFLGTLNYYVWLVIYVALPFALPLIWWLNRSRDPGLQPNDIFLSETFSRIGAIAGGAVGLVSLLMVFSPLTAASFWPWQLTPLMSRIIGSWLLFVAVGLLCLLFERRYIAYRQYLIPAAVWFAILFFASFFHLDNFDFSHTGAWLWFGVTGGASLGAAGSYFYLERQALLINESP